MSWGRISEISWNAAYGLISSVILAGCSTGELPSLATSAVPADPKPVILLTGFEPFGDKRPPNPSWEGVRDLDGTDWMNYRIVAHQLPVVWGEPLKQLQEQIDKYHPVAVFSFGQGAPGTFAIESRAGNLRGEIPDNAGQMPPAPTITSDGPQEFRASFDCQKVAETLAGKGYPIRVSNQAGRYLCEETLYSLELTRSQHHPELTVSFCHVPPLGTLTEIQENGTTRGRIVDKDYVQQFVLDYLGAWQTTSTSQKSAVVSSQKPTGESPNPELPAVKKLIEDYFKSWSEQRMKDYGNCFAEDSVIQEISRSGDIHTQMKGPFVATQTTYHKMALFRAVEVPVRTDITFEADLARAVVYWKLTAGPRIQFGYDHFTLIKQSGQWKIVNLVFYGKKDPE
jgi:pyroglutamyl-peptidase